VCYCTDCQTLSGSAVPGEPPGYSLRVGTLDRRAELVPSRQIWLLSALPWTSDLNLLAAERLDRQLSPPDEGFSLEFILIAPGRKINLIRQDVKITLVLPPYAA
jgi:hypothetical protein